MPPNAYRPKATGNEVALYILKIQFSIFRDKAAVEALCLSKNIVNNRMVLAKKNHLPKSEATAQRSTMGIICNSDIANTTGKFFL